MTFVVLYALAHTHSTKSSAAIYWIELYVFFFWIYIFGQCVVMWKHLHLWFQPQFYLIFRSFKRKRERERAKKMPLKWTRGGDGKIATRPQSHNGRKHFTKYIAINEATNGITSTQKYSKKHENVAEIGAIWYYCVAHLLLLTDVRRHTHTHFCTKLETQQLSVLLYFSFCTESTRFNVEEKNWCQMVQFDKMESRKKIERP